MEEQKLLKKKSKALCGNNKKHVAELCSELGDYYNGKMKYEKALAEYSESASIYQELNMRLENGKSHRMIGEMYMLLAEFDKALIHEDLYLSIARELDNKVEEQRALATLGRAFLLQGQSLSDKGQVTKSLKAAEKAFMKSLVTCESLKNKVNKQELMDMRARLLLNIGVVLEHLDVFDRAIEFLQKAIAICKSHDLYDLLYQCFITEGIIYSNKQNNHSKAISCLNFALDVAGRLDNKVAKQCEAMSLKAGVLCKISDFHSAKSIFLKAWKLKTPDVSEREEIERKLKTVAAICYTEDLLVTTDSNDHETMKKLYEKLGDGVCSLKNYQKGIEFYRNTLEHAEKNGDTGKQLVPIYVSLYQTYKDLKDYKSALIYQKMEFEIIKDDPIEASSTLISIADTLRSSGDIQEAEKAYEQAREEVRKLFDVKRELRMIKILLKFYKEFNFEDKIKQLEDELSSFCPYGAITSSDESSDEQSEGGESENTPCIGDEICLDNLTDVSEDDNEENDRPRVARKRGMGFTIKKNSKGETQLHQACISGNTLLVTRLLSQGHPVNVRDNAGWLPLHEACNHGHKDIVEVLLKHGAHINDRGGTQCDGITPMHDAASNGYLEIVEVLLNNGASPSIKNDHGKSVLDFLKTWRKTEKLDPSGHIFYETLCSRLQKNSDRIGNAFDKSPIKLHNEPKKSKILDTRGTVRRDNDVIKDRNTLDNDILNDSSDSDSSHSRNRKTKSRNILEDESSNSSIEISSAKKSSAKYKASGVKDYKNAIKSLRNRFNTNDSDSDKETQKDSDTRKKGALLNPEEVGDDWLEEDFQPSHSKKRKRQKSANFEPIKRKSNNSLKTTPRKDTIDDTNISHLETDLVSNYVGNIHLEGFCGSDSNSMDTDLMQRENIPPGHNDINFEKFPRSLSSEHLFKEKKLGKRWKHQSTLIKSGFTRSKSDKPKVDSTCIDIGSDSETVSNLSFTSNRSFRGFNECSEEPDSTTEQSLLNSMNFDRVKSSNVLSENSARFVRTPSLDNHIPTQPSLPPAAVRVRIQDKLLLIPVALEKIDSLTIEWLSKEVSRRYYNIEGVQPSVSLLTCDGAILADEDPLSLVIGSTELRANITNWNLPPVGDRYIECCNQLKIDMDGHIRNMLDCSQATHSLSLSDFGLSSVELQPVFKSLNHQTNLTSLILPNNVLGNEGIKYLAQCLPSLSHIKVINLSGNFIDAEGIKSLILLYEKPNSSILHNHLELDLSYNPLGDTGFGYVMRLSIYLRLKSLNLKACDVTPQAMEDVMNLKNLDMIDLGLNSLSRNCLRNILISLSPQIIRTLRLEGQNINGEFLSTVMDNCVYSKLSELDLSRCNLTDSDVTQILRLVSKCEELQTIKLCYNPMLSIFSLRKLIQHSPSFSNINLEGCGQIFKYINDSDMQVNWFKENQLCNIKSMKISPNLPEDVGEKLLQQFSQMWVNKWENIARVEQGLYGGMHLYANETS